MINQENMHEEERADNHLQNRGISGKGAGEVTQPLGIHPQGRGIRPCRSMSILCRHGHTQPGAAKIHAAFSGGTHPSALPEM